MASGYGADTFELQADCPFNLAGLERLIGVLRDIRVEMAKRQSA